MCTEFEADRKITLTLTKPFPTTSTVTFDAVGGGTRVSQTIDAEPGGFFKLAEPLVVTIARRQFQGDLDNLRDLTDSANFKLPEEIVQGAYLEGDVRIIFGARASPCEIGVSTPSCSLTSPSSCTPSASWPWISAIAWWTSRRLRSAFSSSRRIAEGLVKTLIGSTTPRRPTSRPRPRRTGRWRVRAR
jgi:hypothetical protein